MFERTFVDHHAETTRAWPLAVSFLAQSLALCILILIPLVFAQEIPSRQWAAWLLAPPPPASTPVQPVRARERRAPVPARVDDSVLRTPVKVPEKAALIVEDLTGEARPNLDEISGGPGIIDSVPGAVPGGVFSVTGTAPPIPPPPEPSKPEPQAAPSRKLRVSGSVQAARLIHKVTPVYPPLAKQARVSGVVRLEAIIAEDGSVQKLRVIEGHPLLVASAIEAVRQWRYQPTVLNGQPVQVVANIDVHYSLAK